MIKGAGSRGRRAAAHPFDCWTDLVVGYLHHHESPVHGGKMHFPTVGKFMAHGQWRSDKAYALRSSFPFLSSIPRSTSFLPLPLALTHADPNNFYSLFGQTRCTMRRDVSILEQTAQACLPVRPRRIYRAHCR